MAKKTSNTQLLHIRVTKDLHRKIQRDADRHGQTINAEILRRLESSFQSDRMFEGALAPHNAKLVRMIAQAAMMAGDWRGNKTRFDALETAATYIIYAAALELMKREREQFANTKPSRKEVRADEADEMGAAIAQIVIANEMPDHSAREVMREYALEHMRRDERSRIYWGREEKPSEKQPLLKLRELEEHIADKKGEKPDD